MSLPTFCEPVSVLLSRILEAVGVNEVTVTKRRQLYHQVEEVTEIGFHLASKIGNNSIVDGAKIYHFGSKIEGSTTIGLHSDVDLVHIYPNRYSIINSRSDRTGLFMHLMIKTKDATPHGYCRLCVIKNGRFNYQDTKQFYYDSEGTEFFPSLYVRDLEDRLSNNLMPTFRHGPSSYYLNTDNVTAILVPPAFTMTKKRIRSFRKYYWPSKTLNIKLRKTQCFVVPTGHSESENARIEWRISYSFAERLLIFDFNITQVRCLVLLKMIKKEYLQPVVGDGFTSYHCKTTLFHTISRTPPSFWRPDRLLCCLMSCLSTLEQFISNHFCPHFFDLHVNLFVGKLSPWCYKKLSCVVRSLQSDILRCLLQMQTDEVGARMQPLPAVLGMFRFPSRDSIEKQMLAETFHHRHRFLMEYSRLPYTYMLDSLLTFKKQIHAGFKLVREVLDIMNNGNHIKHDVARLYLPHFIAKHASLMAAYRLKKKQPITDDIIDMFKIGFQADATSNRLKLASALYCNGELSKVIKYLIEIEDKYLSHVLPTCLRYVFTFSLNWEKICKTALETFEVNSCRNSFSSCVEYIKNDVWCCPKGLRRPLIFAANAKRGSSLHFEGGMEVDSITMLYYLKYMTYVGLSSALKTMALNKLMQCVVDNPYKWNEYFFDIANKEEKDIVYTYRNRVYAYPDPDIQSYHEVLTPTFSDKLKINPWGSIHLCVIYAFHKCSVVQHMDRALFLIGYCFELGNNQDVARASYWMSNIVEPSQEIVYHIRRVCPKTSIYDRMYEKLRNRFIT
ncbi:uncharacterized protein LOC123557622 [Mercenaria mercenaria]|uniref:uncharacterized protein LOC123557622 n=1 Tax=Mercenaria mercenaria TaxID=6596 RepID=UPI00234EAD54|nr:uncharacterized protein LOC123557622 [Mercenaria mercenaria]